LWMGYLYLSYLSVWDANRRMVYPQDGLITLISEPTVMILYQVAFCVLLLISTNFQANAFSLHRFYRDRLSRAFLFDPRQRRQATGEPEHLSSFKLSQLKGSAGPYCIINAAMNVQGSDEANRRGRNADFFVFTPDFIGSDLTFFASTCDMEE